MAITSEFDFANDIIDRIRLGCYKDYDVEMGSRQLLKVHFDLRYNFVEFHLPDGSSCAEYYGNWEHDEKEIKRTARYAYGHANQIAVGE